MLVDQFMLANQQLIRKLKIGESPITLIPRYGGLVLSAKVGDWRVFRSLENRSFFLAPMEVPEDLEVEIDSGSIFGSVCIHTRCMVCVDLDFLSDSEALQKFMDLRMGHQEKEARDFLRSRGAAVRYGFDSDFDELHCYSCSVPECFILRSH